LEFLYNESIFMIRLSTYCIVCGRSLHDLGLHHINYHHGCLNETCFLSKLNEKRPFEEEPETASPVKSRQFWAVKVLKLLL